MTAPGRQCTEVIVAGGGTAGVAAAIAAARAGVHTVLVEESGYIGGIATMGSLPFLGCHNDRYEQILQGLPWELMSRLMAIGAAAEVRNTSLGDPKMQGGAKWNPGGIFYRPEALKYMLLQMTEEAGVDLLLHTYVCDVVMEGREIAGLVVENKSGRTIMKAGRVVDCTGDADVAIRAGAPYEKGRPADGLMQPMSMLFVMSGIELEKTDKASAVRWPWEAVASEYWRARCSMHSIKLDAWSDALWRELPEFAGKRLEFLVQNVGDGVFYCGNRLHVARLDGSDGDELTRAELAGRHLAWRIVDFARRHVPGFENASIVGTPPYIGIRETRRIIGDYYLTVEDVLEGRKFDDVIALCGNWTDIHDYQGASKVDHPAEGGRVKDGGAYDIPYRCLLPKEVENGLVAGRSISGSQGAHASFRVMGPSMATGQAAGTAAALSMKRGVSPRQLDRADLREALISQGVYLG